MLKGATSIFRLLVELQKKYGSGTIITTGNKCRHQSKFEPAALQLCLVHMYSTVQQLPTVRNHINTPEKLLFLLGIVQILVVTVVVYGSIALYAYFRMPAEHM